MMELNEGTTYGFDWGDDLAKRQQILTYIEQNFPQLRMKSGCRIRGYMESVRDKALIITDNDRAHHHVLGVIDGLTDENNIRNMETYYSPLEIIDIDEVYKIKPEGDSKIRFVFG